MAKKQRKSNHRCKLLPYEIEAISSLSEAQEKAGWQITAFNLPATWNKTQGEGVVVGVIDTGCDVNHPDLVENLIIRPGANILNPKKPPQDGAGHGTHVSGIIAASNNTIGMVGVAPKCKVMPIKALNDNGSGNLDDVATAIRFAVDNGCHMICMSLGTPMKVQSVRKAIQYADSKGVPCFVAAGNAGNTKEIFYPAAYPETIAIGSVDENFDRSTFSCTGAELDFMAPGGKIFSTIPDNWYGVMSGTSMACPFACGVAALVLSFKMKKSLDMPLRNAEDYRKVFREHTIPVNNKNYGNKQFFQGFGIIDPRKFMEHINKVKMLHS